MRNPADDIPAWLASLSDRALRRFSSRLCYVVRIVDAEMQRRDQRAEKVTPQKDQQQSEF